MKAEVLESKVIHDSFIICKVVLFVLLMIPVIMTINFTMLIINYL